MGRHGGVGDWEWGRVAALKIYSVAKKGGITTL